jgi:hypothetical protein
MTRKRNDPSQNDPSQNARLKTIVTGLVAVATIVATATSIGSHGSSVATDDPGRCVIVNTSLV